jgi:hypothetical protein
MIQALYDWLGARVAEVDGVLSFDPETPDLGKRPWFLMPTAHQIQEHWHGSTTSRDTFNLGCLWSTIAMGPAEYLELRTMVRRLALAIESGQGRPANVESFEIGPIQFAPLETGALSVVIPVSMITTEVI